MADAGLVLIRTNADLINEQQKKAQAEQEAQDNLQDQIELGLAAHIRRKWEVAWRHKEPIQNRMLDNLRQIAGRYSDEKARQIQAQGLPLIYMQITSIKCRSTKAWIRDVLMPSGDKPWQIKPTRIPDLNPEVKFRLLQRVQADAEQFLQSTGQQPTPDQMSQVFEQLQNKVRDRIEQVAQTACDRMSDEIEDQLTEGGWKRAFTDVLSDVVDYPAGIIKAPVFRKKRKLTWDGQGVGVQERIVPECERVDPFSFYPAPGIVEPDEGDCIEIHQYRPDEVFDLIGLPGYDEDEIRAVMNEYALHGLTNWTQVSLRTARNRARGMFNGFDQDEITIESLEFWGSVQGKQLIEWGKSPDEVPDPDAMYDVMAEMIGSHVICVRMNPDPLGRKPYGKACFDEVPGAFWGKGVPDLIKDCQDVCNAAARALVANMGISSGPQVAVNTESLAPGQNVQQMFPWKIWQLDYTKTNNSQPPISFFQPDANTDALMKVFQEFSSLADEYSGIPAYAYGIGEGVKGAGKTASGLSMLMNAASKSIKNVIEHIDSGVIEPTISKMYAHNMLWNPDTTIKGDAQVIARGAMSLVVKENNQMRLMQILQETNNPVDMEIIGMEGRADLLRKAFSGVDSDGDFIPSDNELKQRIAESQQQMKMSQMQMGQQSGK